MEQLQEDTAAYIALSKKTIDKDIDNFRFARVFVTFVMVIERLNEPERTEFIRYYSEKLNDIRTERA
jgi:hypothetical protein